ncbi:NADPH:quinone oxidoreductase family protein [Bradyrhizobium sp. BWA-3-5]|uniref:NADPH:quinone oxidoreductase family protein n=1 Tax=Bradyrhizobium sp. BWA-3-5 TaxID=3080013 RepID=UPI00293E726D|nr:NADPH:quinone oxidoreductase family protein [Bradyrhizobium sp. BWA-3-5]WOH63085.1 NADPH:quinone oxidoreductase family protein [Bradyrhizobium sp. BWA-3-5]
MRAILCKAFKGVEALEFAEAAEPRPAANEVLVDVHAASVSYMDYLMSCGGYQMRPALPYVPGTDAAGVVLACGERVTRFRPGDRVSCGNWFGAFAERMVAKETSVALLPAGVDFTVGSTIMHTYLTAWYALIERARLQAGETVLVTGAAGGIGLACVEIAHMIGARVIAVVGGAAKAAMVREHGASEAVDHSCEDVRDRVKALAGDKGLDVCIDNVGGALFATLARLMGWNGRLLPIGFTSGEIPSLAMNLPLLKNYSVVGVFVGAWMERYPDEAARASQAIMARVGEGKLRPQVDRILPLQRAGEAMSLVANRSAMGRIVLEVRNGA